MKGVREKGRRGRGINEAEGGEGKGRRRREKGVR